MITLKTLLLAFAIIATYSISAQVAITTDGSSAAPSAMFEVKSSDKGFLPPRMTSSQRDAIASPAVGLVIFNTTTNCLNFFVGPNWFAICGSSVGTIGTLNCSSADNTGTLTSGVLASGVSSSVPYTGGNGGTHHGQIVTSTGVTGLTATLAAGSFASGAGSLIYTITGTPASSGTASFALDIGGQTCSLELTVSAPPFVCGTSTVTFTYNGSSVTYGTVGSAGGRCWLDRNLGATQVATSSTDAASYGDLFQWGRLDDGHQVRTSPTTATLGNSDVPGHGNFIIVLNSPNDWRSPQNNNLWQGEGGTNNPCPDGYRLPTWAEWDTERASWSNNNAAGAFASTLKLPVAGYRYYSNGSLNVVDSYGFYWSSTVDGIYAWYLRFNSGSAYVFYDYRAIGFSVRCLKD